MDYAEYVMQMWMEGKVEAAVDLKERCLADGLLSDKDKTRLQGIPDSVINLRLEKLANPDKQEIGGQGLKIYRCLNGEGYTDLQIRRITRLSREDLDVVKDGRLRKRRLYNCLIEGVIKAASKSFQPA